MFILSLVLITGFASANTVVSGKIYNSDFSDVIEGADVSVKCGLETLNTESLSDGAYAVIFDEEDCPLDSEVQVSASKGDLSNEDSSNISESEEEEGELVAVVNLNLKGASSGGSSGGTKHSGTWFKCGNTVCDSGETYQTCAKDCPQPVEEVNETVTSVSGSDSEDSEEHGTQEAKESQTTTVQTSSLGITGAVVGNDNSGERSRLLVITLGITLLLIIALLGISIARRTNPKANSGIPEGNMSKYY